MINRGEGRRKETSMRVSVLKARKPAGRLAGQEFYHTSDTVGLIPALPILDRRPGVSLANRQRTKFAAVRL
jgi:hypothetical protein